MSEDIQKLVDEIQGLDSKIQYLSDRGRYQEYHALFRIRRDMVKRLRRYDKDLADDFNRCLKPILKDL